MYVISSFLIPLLSFNSFEVFEKRKFNEYNFESRPKRRSFYSLVKLHNYSCVFLQNSKNRNLPCLE